MDEQDIIITFHRSIVQMHKYRNCSNCASGSQVIVLYWVKFGPNHLSIVMIVLCVVWELTYLAMICQS